MSTTDAANVFLSYAKEDRANVELLAGTIRAKGWTIFWDQGLVVGDDWRKVIRTRLSNAQCVVVVWSENSINSNWVKYEAALGLERGILVPVSIDGTAPPNVFDPLQTENLSGWDGDGEDARIARVLTGVSRIVARQQPAAPAETPGKTSRVFGNPLSVLAHYKRASGIVGSAAILSVLVAGVALAIVASERIPVLWKPPELAKRGAPQPPLRTASPGDIFMPVIGSMKVPENAYRFADEVRLKAQAVLDGNQVVVRKDDVGDLGIFYRVVIEPSKNLEQAELICSRLISAGFKGCFLVLQQRK